jgi:hypothetical protein
VCEGGTLTGSCVGQCPFRPLLKHLILLCEGHMARSRQTHGQDRSMQTCMHYVKCSSHSRVRPRTRTFTQPHPLTSHTLTLSPLTISPSHHSYSPSPSRLPLTPSPFPPSSSLTSSHRSHHSQCSHRLHRYHTAPTAPTHPPLPPLPPLSPLSPLPPTYCSTYPVLMTVERCGLLTVEPRIRIRPREPLLILDELHVPCARTVCACVVCACVYAQCVHACACVCFIVGMSM